MKQKTLRKTALAFLIAFSLASFIFVNLDARMSGITKTHDVELPEAQVSEEQLDEQDSQPVMPSIQLIGKILSLANKKISPATN